MKLAHSRLMNDVVLEGFFRVSANDVEFHRTSWEIGEAAMKNFVRYSRTFYGHGVERRVWKIELVRRHRWHVPL